MQPTKKHHYVPESYLKNFVVNEVLYVLDIPKLRAGYTRRLRKVSPGKICYFEDYYKIKGEYLRRELSEKDSLFIEQKVLTSLENKYPNLYKKVTVSNKLSFSELIEFSDFIIQMKTRNPFWLEGSLKNNVYDWVDSEMAEIIQSSLLEKHFEHIPETLKMAVCDAVLQKHKNNANLAKELQLTNLITKSSLDSNQETVLRKALANSLWILMAAPDNSHFITTDNPGFSICQKKGQVYNVKLTDFALHFPLSPKYCLLITDLQKDNSLEEQLDKNIHVVPINANEVIAINNNIIRFFNKLLIASDTNYLSQIAVNNQPNNGQFRS